MICKRLLHLQQPFVVGKNLKNAWHEATHKNAGFVVTTQQLNEIERFAFKNLHF